MKKINKIIITTALVSLIATAASAEKNIYNETDYINTSNRTLQDVANEKEITVEEFKKLYSLPEDMPANTNEAAAFYSLTVENAAKMYGIPVDDMLTQLKEVSVGDIEITKDTQYGEAHGSITIKNHIDDLSFEDFKKAYNLGENVTENTTIREVRTQITKKQLEFSGMLSYYTEKDILVMADGKYLDFDVAPNIINDRTMVPMRNIFEYFKAEIAWDGETKTILAKSGDDIITMQVGQNFFFLNDAKIDLDSPSVIINDRTLVPVRAISEALKREVGYNSNTKTVIIH